jgi:hypothetical protein
MATPLKGDGGRRDALAKGGQVTHASYRKLRAARLPCGRAALSSHLAGTRDDLENPLVSEATHPCRNAERRTKWTAQVLEGCHQSGVSDGVMGHHCRDDTQFGGAWYLLLAQQVFSSLRLRQTGHAWACQVSKWAGLPREKTEEQIRWSAQTGRVFVSV